MLRLRWVALVTLALASSPVAAEPIEPSPRPSSSPARDAMIAPPSLLEVGGWFGPRLFSSSRLGYIDDAPAHPVLQNGIALGARVAYPVRPWLVPELELAMSPTRTNAVGGADAVTVFWLEPRVHVRFELRPGQLAQPFVVVGGGAPISLSTATRTFATSITGDGYVGGGVRFDTHKGFLLRLDARLAVLPAQPGKSFGATAEFDLGVGIEFRVDLSSRSGGRERITQGPPPPDRDGDGVPDAQDGCPDRAEDVDGFEDDDGCPDIDNDFDRVLDIADKCPGTPELYNGYEDDDGCPDTIPGDVDALRGTVEGLLYAEGETAVREGALAGLRKIAETMKAHPSIRVVLIGHTDDREARQFATTADGQPRDLDAVALDMSRARAEAARNGLIAIGIPQRRILVEARGAADPVADNDRPRGRLANRRVEIKLYVPVR